MSLTEGTYIKGLYEVFRCVIEVIVNAQNIQSHSKSLFPCHLSKTSTVSYLKIPRFNPSNAEATFVQSKRLQSF